MPSKMEARIIHEIMEKHLKADIRYEGDFKDN